MKYPESIYIERRDQMISYQDKIKPFVPTRRELMNVWKLRSTSAVTFVLEQMVEKGMAVSRSSNSKTYYYAVKS